MSLEEINEAYPGVVEGLSQHEGVSFALIHSKEYGGVVIGAKGKYYLKDDRIEGVNPLAKFGKRAAEHLRREDGFNYVPDILLVSMYDTEKEEVAAFEELIGSHGGVGSTQSNPFILYPSDWNLENEEIVGAENVYRLFKREIDNIRDIGWTQTELESWKRARG